MKETKRLILSFYSLMQGLLGQRHSMETLQKSIQPPHIVEHLHEKGNY